MVSKKMENRFSEEEYIQGILLNDSIVLKALYKSCYPPILNFVLKNKGEEQEAKDVYQEAFIILYEKVREGMRLSCQIKTYLYSVSRRQWLKKLYEKNRIGGRIHEMDEYINVEEDMVRAEDLENDYMNMHFSIGLLGEPCKTLITDYYVKQLSMEEIAEKFGYTNANNAKNQKYKCLQRLKKIFFAAAKKTEI
jgi:RNA polymerase sigma factor (sigma-70 family)